MDKRLPFVWRNPEVWQEDKEEIARFTQQFIFTKECKGFSRWERRRGNIPASIFILLPGEHFYRGNQTYRSDIKWMWKKLARTDDHTRIGKQGYLSFLVTDEWKLYKPKTEVIRGSFADAELLWFWVEYVTSHSWWKQKQGKLREMFRDDMSVQDMLAMLTEIKISEED